MERTGFWARCKEIGFACKVMLDTWTWVGAGALIAAFVTTLLWLGIEYLYPKAPDWLEPLAAALAAFGAFFAAAYVISRRAKREADKYRLGHALATGYYFSFVRPVIEAIRADDPIHEDAEKKEVKRAVGLVIAIPQSLTEFDPKKYGAIYDGLEKGPGPTFAIDHKFKVTGPSREVTARLATRNGKSVLVDIPTTLAVIPEFATIMGEQQAKEAPAGSEQVALGSAAVIIPSEVSKFVDELLEKTLRDFKDSEAKVGARGSSIRSATFLLHIVPLPQLRHRLDELTSH